MRQNQLVFLLRQLPLSLAAILLVCSVGVNFANVVSRYFLLKSIFWVEELTVYLAVWSVFLGAVAVAFDAQNLSMDIVLQALPSRARQFAQLVIGIFSAGTCLFVAYQSFLLLQTLWRNDQRSVSMDIPMVIPQASLWVGLVLMAAATMTRIVWRAPAQADTPPSQI